MSSTLALACSTMSWLAVLDAHAARDALHAGILYRSAGEQLDAGRAKQKTATDKRGY